MLYGFNQHVLHTVFIKIDIYKQERLKVVELKKICLGEKGACISRGLYFR